MKNIISFALIFGLSGCYLVLPADVLGMKWVNEKNGLTGINEMQQAGLRDGCQSRFQLRQGSTFYRRAGHFALDAQEIENSDYMFNWQYAGYLCTAIANYERDYGRNIIGYKGDSIHYTK